LSDPTLERPQMAITGREDLEGSISLKKWKIEKLLSTE
jgi:hypothetical protein